MFMQFSAKQVVKLLIYDFFFAGRHTLKKKTTFAAKSEIKRKRSMEIAVKVAELSITLREGLNLY